MKRPSKRTALVLGLLVLLAVAGLAAVLLRGSDAPTELRLDQFLDKVEAGQVRTATISDTGHTVSGELADGTTYKSVFPADYTVKLVDAIRAAEPPIDSTTDQKSGSVWTSLAFNLLPVVLLVGAFFLIVNSMQGGGRIARFGRARTRGLGKDQPKVTFADIAGSDEAVEELDEIKEFLRSPERFRRMGARIPKGVLLYGPPGTGKTLLARAVAGEAGAPFFSISGSDFVEMFVGVGASRVRSLFQQAKDAAPSIIFVDEIDAVGRHRGAGMGGGHDEREQTLNQLLVEMDGFDVTSGVIMIAATNRPDILDPALLRPGRFDRQIAVDRPDRAGRRAILAVHAKGKPLAPGVDLDTVAARTPGFTGADLSNLLNEAALLAARRGRPDIGPAEVTAAIDRVIAGPERRSRVMSDKEKRVIAYHEAGHTLVGHVLPNTDPIHKVSIVARGRALGWTLALPEQDRYLRSRSELRDELAMLLGGRTAEELIFDDPTTGAANDIERVTAIARAMVTTYGMSDRLGPQQFGRGDVDVFVGKESGHETGYSESVTADIDAEVRRLIDEAHAEAHEILTLHRVTLDRLADALVEAETLEGEELDAILGDVGTWDGGPGVADGAPRSQNAGVARSLGPVPTEFRGPGDPPAPPSADDGEASR